MASRQQALTVLSALSEQPGREEYERAAAVLGVPPGQVYLSVTGMPADGGDTYPEEELRRYGVLAGSSQHLVYGHMRVESPSTKQHVLSWIKDRAQHDTQMQAAAALRDAAPGEPLRPEVHDVATVLTRDHDQVTAMLEELKTIPGVSAGGSEVHQSRRESLVDMITIALSKHEAVEEEHFWPAVRSALANGEDVAATALAQEQEGKEILTELGKLSASDERFDELAEQLDKAARTHVAFEDKVLLALDAAMSATDRDALGERLRRAERHAPTRPHRHAPKRPGPVVVAAGAGAAALDRARDRLGQRPASRRGKAEEEPAIRERALEEVSAAEAGVGPSTPAMQAAAERAEQNEAATERIAPDGERAGQTGE